ncbi:conserved hypothetical protein [Burkholderia sp. 8Y]|uniref:hypothetical protein n=1 Tax=Burkholderia sp. 8Y TaxID=2653133 RepID=UPI0012F35770|nr:hypothetical protein [Burkholderia sp. 8Y]VXC81849.1 conserved hypothetical protein [Burkholderia sp. 8Y]
MTALAGIPIARDPLALAALYHAGLGSTWNNQREAIAAFARFSPKVTAEALSRAIAVCKLPPQILALFETAGVWPSTARELIRLARKHGLDALCLRALEIDPLGRSWSEIANLLDGNGPHEARRTVSNISPLALAADYQRGLQQGRWTTMVSAVAASPAWGLNRLTRAVAISKLPPSVLQLFELKHFTWELGATLLKIRKSIGETEMAVRASKMLNAPRRRTIDEMIATLLDVRPEQGVDLAVRRKDNKMIFEFKVDLRETDDLLLSANQIAALVQVAVMNVRFKRQIGTVSLRKRR